MASPLPSKNDNIDNINDNFNADINGNLKDNAPLTVYKASAGSGKTFTLAVEYIKLLVSDPTNYRYTLAVTFTNKATQEMKQRILSKLYGIANALPDSDDYFAKVSEAFPGLEGKTIRSRAKTALAMLVHDYSRFRVETIDSFFQRVLRNLAHELGLTANLQVMLNDNDVESQAVDNIIENIETDSDPLLTWIMDFVRERIDDDKSWNVIGQIKEFGKNIFTDFYKNHQAELRAIMDDAEFFKRYTAKLRSLKAKANKTMTDFADRYDAIAARYGLTDSDYSHGHSNAPGYFDSLRSGNYLGLGSTTFPNSYVSSGIDNPEKLVKKADIGKPSADAIIRFVAPLLREAEDARKEAAVTVNSVDLTLQNVNQLRLLGRIEKEVANINAANNDYLLSNTQKLLNDLIDRQDSPFIYEKIGGQLRFIMIDEFQDTSCVQWENFKVLLDDCIAHQAGSLIVGDVKQSIYRWRNGDWHLLQDLNEENYPAILRVKPLTVNYRSQRNVVDFNNAFFTAASAITADSLMDGAPTEGVVREAEEIKTAYSDVAQEVPAKRPRAGLVKVTMLPKEDYDTMMVDRVRQTIEWLLGEGIPQRRIAVIVRKNKHIKLLADYFLHNAVSVGGKAMMLNMVSDEAFRLDASLAVNVIVKAMHLLTHPTDRLTEAFLAKAYHKCSATTNTTDIASDADIFVNGDGAGGALPSEFTTGRTRLLATPLIDLAERLYAIFHIEALNGQSAYVCAFFDQLSTYLKRHVAGIDDFLAEWDESICAKSIHSDEIDGIRLLTVHKSKGLEFDNVIMPFCDWEVEDSRDILWVQPDQEPYDGLPVVPVNLQPKRLKNSIYSTDYESEHIKNVVDNLNILYVAFTRASRNLFVIGKKGSSKYPSKIISDVITAPDFAIDGARPEVVTDDDESVNMTYGSLCPSEEDKPTDGSNNQANIFERKERGVRVEIENTNPHVTFIQSNDSKEFMTPDDELDELSKRQSYIDTGNILHKLFATIHDYTEVNKAIDELEFSGVLYDRPMTREKLREYISKELAIPQVREWFSPRWKVFTECSILSYNPTEGVVCEHRPDRVIYDGSSMTVIDFKTGREREEHQGQVREYMSLLSQMGHGNIRGFLWYIRHNNIIEVKA